MMKNNTPSVTGIQNSILENSIQRLCVDVCVGGHPTAIF